VELDGLSAKDAELARLAAAHSGACCAYSFMRDGREADWLRGVAPRLRVWARSSAARRSLA